MPENAAAGAVAQGSEQVQARKERAFRLARRHGYAYAGVIAVLVVVDWATAGTMWSIWPLLGWGVVFAFHYFYVRSVHVSDDWAEERTQDLRYKSYDLSHIHSIQARHRKGLPRRPNAPPE